MGSFVILIILCLAVVSIALSFRSLHNLKKMREVSDAKKDLNRSKIVFHADALKKRETTAERGH